MKKLKPIWQTDRDGSEFAIINLNEEITIKDLEHYQENNPNYEFDMLSFDTFKIIKATLEEDYYSDLIPSEEDIFIDMLESQTYWVNLNRHN